MLFSMLSVLSISVFLFVIESALGLFLLLLLLLLLDRELLRDRFEVNSDAFCSSVVDVAYCWVRNDRANTRLFTLDENILGGALL